LHITRVPPIFSFAYYGVPREKFQDILIFVTKSGEEIKLKPYSGALNIDFGKGIRKKNVYLL
jgi:hypothetical protein